MSRSRTSSPRGFTLIELMIVVAIIGVLASVAIPSFLLMNERAKTAERGAIVRGIKSSLDALRVKDGSFGAGINGAWNPALPLSTLKRQFDFRAAGWSQLDLSVEGMTYYSYFFRGEEGSPSTITISVQGDVDGNGEVYNAVHRWEFDPGSSSFLKTMEPTADYDHGIF